MDSVIEPAPKRVKMEMPLISFVIPAHNASSTIDDCIASICESTYRPLEIAVYNDASTDDTLEKLNAWVPKCKAKDITLHVVEQKKKTPGGAGYAKNRAAEACSGMYFAFLDSDDMVVPERVEIQLKMAKEDPKLIVGANFKRTPEGSTWHYTAWANSLTNEQLVLQQYRECTIIMPTWFMRRERFLAVGCFSEAPEGVTIPEDLIFFLKHLELGGTLAKSEEKLVIYRHSSGSVCSKLPRRILLRTRLASLERRVLSQWTSFTIWGCGRDGKNFFVDLSEEYKKKVTAFCDVNEKKIGTKYYCRETKTQVPIIHFSEAKPPIICCVSMGRTDGELEANIKSLNLVEGVNFWHFN
ncbi:UDP-GlcNAc:betaGal beta-1,3-N-acetylglucosaminyltransferase 1-like [Thraustotheca clavata]|uniref:UDP-GlcNAc:betaGal beta-1,3-N-acetylglucosaminyltransferase 1-like n=1 Tax=Thraustotheca clavata TaxID=74557 RepID=A0A1V9ZXD5_9STRA|nr:UDP-GlcNAc:betaGal beta-1,3-N-acetylglucosaminyltransferase 1-like [Thraustotheca clavata]